MCILICITCYFGGRETSANNMFGFFLFQIHFRAIGEGASIGDGDDKYVTQPLIDNYNTVMLSACNRVTRTRA